MNDFLYEILGDQIGENQKVMREYFKLDQDDGSADDITQIDIVDVITANAEKYNLNNLFFKSMQKTSFYDEVKNIGIS